MLLHLFLLSLVWGLPVKADFHFVHVPKSGGSTVTTYLRQYEGCQPPGFCCTAPGFPVGVCNETRLCEAVVGCTRHEPHISLLNDDSYRSVLSLRDPLQRALSGFLYPHHHGSHSLFSSFVRDLRYQNVAVKMLNGMGPYDNERVTEQHVDTALQRLHQFDFIMLAEAMQKCIRFMFIQLPGSKQPHFFSDARVNTEKRKYSLDPQDRDLFNQLNKPDLLLYQTAVDLACTRQHVCIDRVAHVDSALKERLSQLRAQVKSHHTRQTWTPPVDWNSQLGCRDAYFYHFPGRYKSKLDPAVRTYFKNTQPFPPLDPEVVLAFPYVGSKPDKSLAERMYKHHSYPYINYLEGEARFVRWWSKVGPLMELLRSRRHNIHSYKYIVVHDASDVLLMNPPTDIVQRFEAYDTDILMGTTDADWPHEHQLQYFENKVAPWSRHHAHITAGMFMARVHPLLDYMFDLELESRNQTGMFNDQRHWRRLHARAYPNVKADSFCRIFVRADEFIDSV